MEIRIHQLAPTFIEPAKIAGSAVWNNDIVFKTGERIQIIAPSGSGKTSLIHFLYGIRKDHTGTVYYDENDINDFSAENFAAYRKNRVSIVFQDLRLFGEQTVLQNLEVKRQLHPYHEKSLIEQMASRLGILSRLDKLARTCSYGEQQRIAIIRALQQPFDILLLDEPFSHLDDNNRMLAMELMDEEVAKRNACIILADLKETSFYKSDIKLNL